MEFFIWLCFAIALIWFLSYHRASLSTFTLSFIVLMIIGTFTNTITFVSWLVFAIFALPFNINEFRKKTFSVPLLTMYKKIMPTMSSTEQEAIDAGTTWFEADLFRGTPDWHKLHNYPKPRLSAQERDFIHGPVEELCAVVDDWQICHELADLPEHIWLFLKEHRFFAMNIDKSYGGLGFSAYAQSRVLQKLAGISAVVASTVGVPNSLGPGELIHHYGTKEQKDYYLPRLACGEEIPCFALTNPEAGSDAGSIPDYGIVCYDKFKGEQVLGMRLTWDKRYITLAPIATVLGLAFKLQDPDKIIGDKVDLGITCALIPTDLPGIIIGRRHFPLNIPFQNGPTQANEVFVPLTFIIGGIEMAGQGWRMLVECLSVGRAITLPSNSTGAAKSVALATGAYCRIRRQFKMPIGKMEGIEQPLAYIGANAYLMDAVTSMSTGAIDLGEKPAVISAIAKYHLTEKMRKVMINAMDIHGGKGVCMGPKNYLARGYQGAPIAITVEGANILTRNMIIYGQGAIRCHPYILAELKAAQDEDEQRALDNFDHALFSHIGFAISNIMRSFWFSITRAKFQLSPFKDQTKKHYRLLTRLSANLAMLSDIAMLTYGGELKRKERMSARLGDILSYLYLASACLKKYHDEGRNTEDLPLLQWSIEDCNYRAEQAINDLINNFDNKVIAIFLRIIILPLGCRLKKPSDKTEHKIAQLLQKPCSTRDRLGSGQYLTNTDQNVFALLEKTLEDIINCEPIFNKVCRAVGDKLPFYHLDEVAIKGLIAGAITEEEAQLLRKTEIARKAVIDVDDFDSSYLAASSTTR